MSITEQVLQLKQDFDDVYEAGYNKGKAEGGDTETAYNQGMADGKQAEHDRFWDAYQDNGQRTVYRQAFMWNGWTDETYNPKYDIVLDGENSSMQTFYSTQITDTKKPIILKSGALNGTFYSNQKLKTIRLLKLEAPLTTATNPFYACLSLEEIRIEGSTIDVTISFAYSPNLTAESVQSIIDHLATVTTAQTITFHADVKAKLTDEQKATITTTKGWTLA